MKKSAKAKTEESQDSVIVKITMSHAQRAWLQQQAGRGNVAEFIRSKVFGTDYTRNKRPASRYRWELAVALNWVGNNLQRLTEKFDQLAEIVRSKQPRETEIIALIGIVQLLKKCAEVLVQISNSISGKDA